MRFYLGKVRERLRLKLRGLSEVDRAAYKEQIRAIASVGLLDPEAAPALYDEGQVLAALYAIGGVRAGHYQIGPHNDAAILGAATEADRVMAAWGVHGAHLTRGAKVTQMLTSAGFELWCPGTTKSGAPRHPRFVVPEAPIHRFR